MGKRAKVLVHQDGPLLTHWKVEVPDIVPFFFAHNEDGNVFHALSGRAALTWEEETGAIHAHIDPDEEVGMLPNPMIAFINVEGGTLTPGPSGPVQAGGRINAVLMLHECALFEQGLIPDDAPDGGTAI